MKHHSIYDSTQIALFPYLQTTEALLARVASKLSGCSKTAEITDYPDLGIPKNLIRIAGGFLTGARYTWDTDVPFIPVDATVNVCGTALVKLKCSISSESFVSRVTTALSDTSKYTWNYQNGNHCILLVKSNGDYGLEEGLYMLVHASANEFKEGPNGLYPYPGIWYENFIQTEYFEDSARYLRYISGEHAIKFYETAKMLINFNKERNLYFMSNVLGAFFDKEILSIAHYGMPNEHTVCIGTHWENSLYTLLTAPGRPVFLVQPEKDFDGSPHGLGLYLKKTKLELSKDSLTVGDKIFPLEKRSLDIGTDALNRCANPNENLDSYVSKIIQVCPGKIVGKLHQLCSISKDGIKIWSE